MCEPISTTTAVLLAVSAAATAASTYASYQAAEQQDAANADSITRQANEQYRLAKAAMAERQANLENANRIEDERRKQKMSMSEKELQENSSDSFNKKYEDEVNSLLNNGLAAVNRINEYGASDIGGDDTGVRVVAENRNSTIADSLRRAGTQQRGLASLLARQNINLGNNIGLSNLRDQFNSMDNIYQGEMGAVNLSDSLSNQLYNLGMSNANVQFQRDQSRLPLVGQGWRTASGIASGVASLSGTAAAGGLGGGSPGAGLNGSGAQITGNVKTAAGTAGAHGVPTINNTVPAMAGWRLL